MPSAKVIQLGRCPKCGRMPKRTSEQNKRYWQLITNLSANLPVQESRYGPEAWHTYMKMRYLGADEVSLPNGKTIVSPKSTSDLDRMEFADYMTQVEAWCNEHGVWLDE